MKAFTLCALFVASLMLTACGEQTNAADSQASSPETIQAQLQSEVMAIHDEVMPRMGEINRISRGLRTYLEEHPDLAPDQKESITQTVSSLDRADAGMMDWMAAYGGVSKQLKELDHAAIMQALEKEKEKISGVRDLILSSIENGKGLLAKLQSGEE